jgi:hypothetical protein
VTVIGSEAYPLRWPDGWPRTPAHARKSDSLFEGKNFTPGRVRDLLLDELRLLKATNVIISSNVPLRPDGLPYAQSGRLDDPGIAVYFKYKNIPYVYFEDEPGAFNTTAMSRTRLSAAVQLGLHFEVAGSHREWGSCREECQDRVSPTRPPQCRVDQ